MSALPSGADGRRRTFRTLDGLRGVAAVAVVFRHAPPNIIGEWTGGSYRAVDLFFVLSGFVLAHAYDARLRSGLTVASFMVQRLIRLYPLYLLGTLIGLGVAVTTGLQHVPIHTVDSRTIVHALLFLPKRDWALANLYPLDYPAWSLFFELLINLVFALIARRLGVRLLTIVLVVSAGLLVFTANHYGSLNVGFDNRTAWGGIGRVVFTFFAGVAVQRIASTGRWSWLVMPAWLAAALVVLMFVIDPPAAWMPAYDSALALVVMPALILAAARREPPTGLIRPFAVLGTASYALYILHLPILNAMTLAVRFATNRLGTAEPRIIALDPVTALLWIVPIFAAVLILDRFYDIPVRAWLTRAWRRRGSSAT